MLKSLILSLPWFPMKYADLTDPDHLISPESNLHKKYILHKSFFSSSNFISFNPWHIPRRSYKKIETNWKARLSIDSEDLDRAWEIIFPILCEKSTPFKVANRDAIEKFKNEREEKLRTLTDEYDHFLQQAHSQDIKSLRNTYYKISQRLSANNYSSWRLISFIQTYFTKLTVFFNQLNLNRENLFDRTKKTYELLIDLRKQKVKNSLRFHEGMQFTIYILPGFEKECQDTLEEIERNLLEEKIRAGIIFTNDRQIGIYSSIRHPGKWKYHKATDSNLETYNPDNIEDPFRFLKTLPANEIIQEDETQPILEQADSPEFIVSILRTKRFIAPSIVKALAIHKENVVEHMKTLPLESRRELVIESLDKSTNLGAFFRVKRGLFTPKSGHGTLKQIENMSINPF